MFGLTATTLAWIAVGTTAVSAGMSAYGQYESGQSQQKWSRYNADVQREQAKAVLHQADVAANRKREEGQRLMAKQRVLYAKGGLDMSGTPTELMLGTARDIEIDAQAIMQKGEMGYSQNMESATISEGEGDVAASSGTMQAGATLLSGLGKAADLYSANYKPGVSGSDIKSAYNRFE